VEVGVCGIKPGPKLLATFSREATKIICLELYGLEEKVTYVKDQSCDWQVPSRKALGRACRGLFTCEKLMRNLMPRADEFTKPTIP
jgi:hypothetical protein